MTGTSCDGIDVACIEFEPSGKWRAGWVRSRPYPAALRERVLAAQVPGTRLAARDWLELDRDLGEWMGSSLHEILATVPRKEQPHLLALHGQTIAHFPPTGPQKKNSDRGTTWQAGNLASVAAATGITVAGQFRLGDLAVGGQGAPLMPRFHLELAGHLDLGGRAGGHTLSFLNIGGMANFSVIDRIRTDRKIEGALRLGYDTGPGNCWIDLAVAEATDGRRTFDEGGKLAASAEASTATVEKLLASHPHFGAKPPKSTGRDQFPWAFFAEAARGVSGAALVATATELTAESICRSYVTDVLPGSVTGAQDILVCGGGAKNRELMRRLQEKFAVHGVRVRSLAELGWDPMALEAQGFALFAYRTLQGIEQGGSWTGAPGWAPPGFLVPGRNWKRLAEMLPAFVGETTDGVAKPLRSRSMKTGRSASPSKLRSKTRKRR